MTAMSDTTQIGSELPRPPMLLRLGVLVVSVVVGVSALPWIWYSLGYFGGFDWALFGFEVLALFGGIFGVLLGMGRFRAGWGIGVTAIAGSVLVGFVFGLYRGYIFPKRMDEFPDLATITNVTFAVRCGAVVLLGGMASLAVFARSSRSWGYVVWSAVVGVPMVVGAGMIYKGIGPGAWVQNLLGSSGPVAGVTLLSVGLIGIVMFSISAHLLIRAFECGRPGGVDGSDQKA